MTNALDTVIKHGITKLLGLGLNTENRIKQTQYSKYQAAFY